MKTLAEINAERREIIEEGLNNILKRRQRGVVYSAQEVSAMSGSLLSVPNLQAGFERARRECAKGTNCYLLFGCLPITPVIKYRTFTYKVYDENGELVKTYTKDKPIIKVKF